MGKFIFYLITLTLTLTLDRFVLHNPFTLWSYAIWALIFTGGWIMMEITRMAMMEITRMAVRNHEKGKK
jgi:hypothetical protein